MQRRFSIPNSDAAVFHTLPATNESPQASARWQKECHKLVIKVFFRD